MTKNYSVHLPVKPYVKKYVETVEGTPLHFRSGSMICTIIRAYMENKNNSGRSAEELQRAITLRTAKLTIMVPLSKMRLIGVTINPHGVLLINRWLEECFDRALRQFMKDHVRQDGRYRGFKEAYQAFAELYNIELEEDITLDGLKQMDYRHRRQSRNANHCSLFVPAL